MFDVYLMNALLSTYYAYITVLFPEPIEYVIHRLPIPEYINHLLEDDL